MPEEYSLGAGPVEAPIVHPVNHYQSPIPTLDEPDTIESTHPPALVNTLVRQPSGRPTPKPQGQRPTTPSPETSSQWRGRPNQLR